MFVKTDLLRFVSFALLSLVTGVTSCQADTVRFNTNLGSFKVDLFENAAPQTVANFLFYLNNGDYNESVIHRSFLGRIIQGGGYYTDGTPVPEVAPVPNEPSISNTRGTIAMAKVDGFPDSATNQWFFNVVDNPGLNTSNGGFTVFGQVLGDGMDIVDQIASLPVVNANPGPTGPFGELPILDISLPIDENNLVVVHSIVVIPEPTGLSFPLFFGILLACRRRRISTTYQD